MNIMRVLLMKTQCHVHVKSRKPLKRPSESEVAKVSKARTVKRRRKDETVCGARF